MINTQKVKKEIGFVVEAKNYLYYIEGLPSVKMNDLIISEDGARALVVGLEGQRVEALMLDRVRPKPGELFLLSENGLNLPPGSELLGRAINPLGVGLDGKGNLTEGGSKLELEVIAPGVDKRALVIDQIETGMTAVDTLVPIAKGQRELIFGEPRSGKTGFLLDVIANQKGKDIICIYAGIGKSEVELKKFYRGLKESGSTNYTILLGAASSESAPVIYIAPSVAIGLADQFRSQGQDVLVILDDLGKHAKYLREIALLAERIPGRESYPGDVFYQHAHLIERAGNFNELAGNGSITLLPVMETDLENFTALIPTNLMASTDGHLLFTSKLRTEGRYPAVDVEASVTRVGKQTQNLVHKIMGDRIRKILADYEELRKFSRFGADVSDETRLAIKRGMILQQMINQDSGQKIEIFNQMIFLGLIFTNFFNDKEDAFISKHKRKILTTIETGVEFNDLKREMQTKIKEISIDDYIQKITNLLPVIEKAWQT